MKKMMVLVLSILVLLAGFTTAMAGGEVVVLIRALHNRHGCWHD